MGTKPIRAVFIYSLVDNMNTSPYPIYLPTDDQPFARKLDAVLAALFASGTIAFAGIAFKLMTDLA